MSKSSRYTGKVAPKADRLGWKPLRDVQPVRLSAETIQGKAVSAQELAKRKRGDAKQPSNLLVP